MKKYSARKESCKNAWHLGEVFQKSSFSLEMIESKIMSIPASNKKLAEKATPAKK